MSGSASSTRAGGGLAALLAIATLLLAAAAIMYFTQERQEASAIQTAPVDALYGIAVDAEGAVAGNEAAVASFQSQLQQLKDSAAAYPSAPFAKDARFSRLVSDATAVSEAKGALIDAGNAARETRDLVPRLITEMGAIVGNLTGPNLDIGTRALERFDLRAQRLQLDVTALVTGGATNQAAQRLAESNDYLGQVIQGLQGANTGLALPKVPSGPDTEKRLKALDTLYTDLNSAVRRAVTAAPALPAAQAAARDITADARAIANAAKVAEPMPTAGKVPAWLPGALLLGALVVLVLGVISSLRVRKTVETQRVTVDTQRKENDRNQQAILRLLDELSSLADGDLTVQATVTEDITGAIADSINYAVDALRGLVTTINQSAIQLDSATRQTQALSQHLAKASGAQSKQISSATESAGSMASSVEEVSGNAERAADVARHSVEVAHKGGDAVRRTIDGDEHHPRDDPGDLQAHQAPRRELPGNRQHRGAHQRHRRADQHSRLECLDPGFDGRRRGPWLRGRRRRSATLGGTRGKCYETDRSAGAHDSDRHDTRPVVSMERSTTDVVGGALLAENAGAALEEIEQVSNQIASLVQNISGSSRQQTGAAQNIARNMQVLKEISVQTAESTNATSAAIASWPSSRPGCAKPPPGSACPGPAPSRSDPPAPSSAWTITQRPR